MAPIILLSETMPLVKLPIQNITPPLAIMRELKYNNGYNNVFVGANVDVTGAGFYNVVVIGQGTTVSNSDEVYLGNLATTQIGGAVAFAKISDGRFKSNIKQDVPGLQLSDF